MLSSSPARAYRSLLFGAAALALLLVLLATLQYRWIGQVGEADAARLRAGARSRAEQLARDFDREITRAFLWLQADPASVRDRDGAAYAGRWARWTRSAPHPALVRAVYLVQDDALFRFEPGAGAFQPAAWPAELARVRERLRDPGRPPEAPGRPFPRRGSELIDDAAPALLAPVPSFGLEPGRGRDGRPDFRPVGRIVILLDGAVLRTQVLPDLARRHFGAGEESDYTVVVRRRAAPGEVVYRSDSGAGDAPRGGDATAGLFELRFEDAAPEDLAGLPRPSREPGRGRPEPFRFGADRRPGFEGWRGDGGHWQLVVTHRAGSVDAVVAAARRRNLGVGAAMLALLAASAVLIVASAQRARRLADRQLEFVAGVSHELRTPVAVICSAAENLADGVVSDADTVRQYGRVVRDEGRRLAEMVEQVLDFAGTYSGRHNWRLEDLDVSALLAQCQSLAALDLREAGLAFESAVEPGLPRVRGDRAAVRRAIQNLLQNAIKHAGDGGWIGLGANAAVAAGRPWVRITVEDRGPGIPPSEAGHVFEPFFRGAEAVSRQVRGSGLGLSLVKRIVEAHGGTVGVESTPGRGSAFTIALPGLPAPETASETAPHGTPHPSR